MGLDRPYFAKVDDDRHEREDEGDEDEGESEWEGSGECVWGEVRERKREERKRRERKREERKRKQEERKKSRVVDWDWALNRRGERPGEEGLIDLLQKVHVSSSQSSHNKHVLTGIFIILTIRRCSTRTPPHVSHSPKLYTTPTSKTPTSTLKDARRRLHLVLCSPSHLLYLSSHPLPLSIHTTPTTTTITTTTTAMKKKADPNPKAYPSERSGTPKTSREMTSW